MLVKDIRAHKGTLKKLKNLLNDPSKKVQGVFYTNSFFSRRYLCRSHVLVDGVDITNDQVKLKVTTRVEQAGLIEIENTLTMLVHYEAGDVPGFSPEGLWEDPEADRPHLPEAVSVKQKLFSVDIQLILRNPEVTYQEFTIAGSKFTLINLKHVMDEGIEQTVTLLFGSSDKLYFFSHFHDKELSQRDMKIILDLILDENITGKAFTGIKLESGSGTASSLFPMEELISSYTNMSGDIVFSTGTGFIRIGRDQLKDYKLRCNIIKFSGEFQLVLESKTDKIYIYTE